MPRKTAICQPTFYSDTRNTVYDKLHPEEVCSESCDLFTISLNNVWIEVKFLSHNTKITEKVTDKLQEWSERTSDKNQQKHNKPETIP